MSGTRKPHYTCEHCGAEVGRNDKICRYCGHFFTSVKCPKCGYSGEVREFDRGCPVCGHVERMNAEPDSLKPQPGRKARIQPTALPFWVYFSVALVALVSFFLLLRALH